jgi:hypothetical protein
MFPWSRVPLLVSIKVPEHTISIEKESLRPGSPQSSTTASKLHVPGWPFFTYGPREGRLLPRRAQTPVAGTDGCDRQRRHLEAVIRRFGRA